MMGTSEDQYARFVNSAAWSNGHHGSETESFGYQVREFVKGVMEMSVEFAKGCRDIVRQSLGKEDSFMRKNLGKLKGPCEKVCGKLRFFNEYLPEDKDPLHAWSVICFVLVLAFAGNTEKFCWVIKTFMFLFFFWLLLCYAVLCCK